MAHYNDRSCHGGGHCLRNQFLNFLRKGYLHWLVFAFIENFTNLHFSWMVSVQLKSWLARMTMIRLTTGVFP
jgi:hypothetical protein